MSIIVKNGVAWINGYRYENDSDLSITLDSADGTNHVLIVLLLD